MPHAGMNFEYTSWGKRENSTHYYRYGGKTECNYIRHLPGTALHCVLRSMYYDFPHRPCRWVNIGDNCPSDTKCNCAGHPENSHKGGYSLDIEYFTLTTSNITEKGTPRTVIWNDDGTLKTDVFDWERTYHFITRMARVFPKVLFMMDERIRLYLCQQIEKHFGYDAKRAFQMHTQGDAPKKYNHDTHMHCTHLDVVELDALIDDWVEMEWRMAA
ncbi:MAG TPA: hypothetical protein PKM59_11640 [Thermodesulfobacteriota bacterium]|nr:hypothetical protein [Thermodesulfobacteriota bacterium]HNU70386.1 hypothetical protein [Thermodesulfobacteriota bacterium]